MTSDDWKKWKKENKALSRSMIKATHLRWQEENSAWLQEQVVIDDGCFFCNKIIDIEYHHPIKRNGKHGMINEKTKEMSPQTFRQWFYEQNVIPLCRKCHMIADNRMQNLKIGR